MADKLYYSMGEVAELFDVNASLIRHWESQFPELRPKRNKKGNRLFSPEDVERLKLIYHLVKEQGMTLDGAKKSLRQQRGGNSDVPRDVELLERLQRIRALLVEVREELKTGEGEILADADADAVADMADQAVEVADEAMAQTGRKRKAVMRIEPAEELESATPKAPRKPRRKKEDAEHKELFAFYEQSLF